MRQSSSTLLRAATPEAMRALGHALGIAIQRVPAGALVVALEGELGAGKTTLVGGVLAACGITGPVRSPTYTLVEPYQADSLQLHHIDLYRLAGPHEVEALGLRDLMGEASVLLIEWPSKGAGALPPADLELVIEYLRGEAGRSLLLRAGSSAGEQLVEQMLAAASE